MRTDIATLPNARGLESSRRGRLLRRIGAFVILLFVAAGGVGLLGVHEATVTAATGGGYRLSVDYAQVSRAGLALPFRVHVEHPGGFVGHKVTLVISRGMFDRFDFQNFYANPSAETSSPADVYYDLDPPPGNVLSFVGDLRTGPNQNGSVHTYRVALRVDRRPVTDVSFRMVVVP